MRVYIASQYKKKAEINQKIYDKLHEENIEAFLPASINIDALAENPGEQRKVADICYDEIQRCDVILGVWRFGISVSSELGYAIALNRWGKQNKKIIIFDTKDEDINFLKNEVMIWPYIFHSHIDKIVESVSELIDYLKTLE